jgi:hypothetical protein
MASFILGDENNIATYLHGIPPDELGKVQLYKDMDRDVDEVYKDPSSLRIPCEEGLCPIERLWKLEINVTYVSLRSKKSLELRGGEKCN